MSRLPRPDISRDGEALRSNQFGDIYYQEADGLAETRHVFLDGNDLPERFARHAGTRPFIIGELGFGTGLNLLAAAHLFEEVAPSEARLHFWSAEGFPLDPEELGGILSAITTRWPELGDWAERLARAYPRPRPGQVQIDLSDRVRLTLGFGPATEVLSETDFHADAWFLDGFSPAQNPEMWSEDLLHLAATHTRPGGSFATFTVAGAVRRSLEAAGFTLARRQGFGRKREMLTGRMPGDETSAAPQIRKLTIIGAGIAGACAAFEARRAGLDVEIIDRESPGAGASGNPAGLLMPRLEAQDNPAARFYRDAFLFARRFYGDHSPDALLAFGGAMQGETERYHRVLETGLWPDGELHLEADRLLAGAAALLSPRDAIAALIEGCSFRQGQVEAIDQSSEHITLTLRDGTVESDAVLVSAGPRSAKLAGFEEDMSASRGQVDIFAGPAPPHILTEGTYIAPLDSLLIAGATYDPAQADDVPEPDEASSAANRVAAEALLHRPAGNWISARASLRATTRDRHPIAGELDESGRVFALTGLGSRGLVTAPILARHLIARMTGDVSPLSLPISCFAAPGRFAERRRRRGQS
ncbi:tRNA (5-methylaminomethyl-2-thiouridine)(34)-methyltransferase MnmD [Parvularcula marina]|uniref:tRNA 5-methylaminomethyl-2-thiouridine biosynthesis bifunctional protein MnmC n=1 Tax=Parvularcula marina TaxID=2292771 RepID=A0A371RK97_9PROT|nr:tRNA (5-methylaminomethyl-2-thiouridine)(34)-methyltransferase MnmD [Parvularcula marina]RFB05826.1 FAD-dependent oxidoreductase [Parvularcula marina]